jgi:hypothetical protein
MGLLLSAVMLAHVILALFFQAAFMLILQPKFIQQGLFFEQRPQEREGREKILSGTSADSID